MDIIDILPLIAVALAGALILQTITFGISRYLRRVDVVDVAWGLSAIAIVVALHAYGSPFSPVALLVDALVIAWGARLSWHIARRIQRSPEQDPRYTKIMSKWPRKYHTLQIFGKIFVLQAILATLVSLPVVVLHFYHPEILPVVLLGAAIWVIGFSIESAADMQLRQFLRTAERGELLQSGLWRYSRHPNYFGEVTMWWGIAIMTFVTPLWWLGAVGALTITILIRFVSGVPLAEANAARKKGWQQYQRLTSILVLWPPKQ